MCNRHVAHMIADYEAARLDGDEEATDGAGSGEPERTVADRPGLLATLKSRLAR